MCSSWWWRTEIKASSKCAWKKCKSAFNYGYSSYVNGLHAGIYFIYLWYWYSLYIFHLLRQRLGRYQIRGGQPSWFLCSLFCKGCESGPWVEGLPKKYFFFFFNFQFYALFNLLLFFGVYLLYILFLIQIISNLFYR